MSIQDLETSWQSDPSIQSLFGSFNIPYLLDDDKL